MLSCPESSLFSSPFASRSPLSSLAFSPVPSAACTLRRTSSLVPLLLRRLLRCSSSAGDPSLFLHALRRSLLESDHRISHVVCIVCRLFVVRTRRPISLGFGQGPHQNGLAAMGLARLLAEEIEGSEGEQRENENRGKTGGEGSRAG